MRKLQPVVLTYIVILMACHLHRPYMNSTGELQKLSVCTSGIVQVSCIGWYAAKSF